MRDIPMNYGELEKLLARKIEVYTADPELGPLYETLISKKAIASSQFSHDTMGKSLSAFGLEKLGANVREALIALEQKYQALYKNAEVLEFIIWD